MDDKGIIFTTDALLALVVITIAVGISINQLDTLNYQLQDFTGRQSLDKTVNDAADYLVKSSGNPVNWETPPISSTDLPGLAALSGTGSLTNPSTNFLDKNKIDALTSNPGLLTNLVNTTNYDLLITPINASAYTPIHITSASPTTPLSSAREVAVANRTVVLPTTTNVLQFNDLMHVNPAHQSGNDAYLWYVDNSSGKNGTTIYVGPGNVTTTQNVNSSFYPDTTKNDYYIYVPTNFALGGSPVNSVQYGFTSGNAVVSGTYGGLNDKARSQAIQTELNQIYSPGNWQNLKNTNPGSFTNVNNQINQALTFYNITPGSSPGLKMWISINSNPKAFISVWLIAVPKGTPVSSVNVPSKLVLTIWK